jgi:hypothetical protein
MHLRNEQNAHSVGNRQPDGAPGSFLNFSSHLLGFNCSAETQVIKVRVLLATSQSGGPLPASYGHNAPIGVFQALDSGTRTRTFVEPVSRPDLMAIGRNITASFRLFQSSMHRSMARLFGPLTKHGSACEARLCCRLSRSYHFDTIC